MGSERRNIMDIFSEVENVLIISYTRKQAIADGILIDITETAIEAGFKFHVAVTHAVWNQYIVPSEPLKEMGHAGVFRVGFGTCL